MNNLDGFDSEFYQPNALLLRKRTIEKLMFDLEQARNADGASDYPQNVINDTKAAIQSLQAMNYALCNDYQQAIKSQGLSGDTLRTALNAFTAYSADVNDYQHFDYEDLDVLLQGIFETVPAPEIYIPKDPEMVHMERTPGSAILDLVDHVQLQPNDTFVDLGSGYGLVPMMVHLLTSIPSVGIEIDTTFHSFAQTCAADLGVKGLRFINSDVRNADISMGTIFYLFTPFTGTILRDVLRNLQTVSKHHPITVVSFGPCTPWLAQIDWLHQRNNAEERSFVVTLFTSER